MYHEHREYIVSFVFYVSTGSSSFSSHNEDTRLRLVDSEVSWLPLMVLTNRGEREGWLLLLVRVE